MTLDPTNADALAGAAYVDAVDYAFGWSDQSADLYARAMQRADQALLLDPDQASAHYTKALLIMFKAKPNDAASANEIIAEAEASLRADPSFAGAYWPMAVGEMLLGHYEQSISDLEQAMRISPRDSNHWNMAYGNGQSRSWRCVDTMRRSRKVSKPSTRGIARRCLTLPLRRSTLRRTRGAEAKAALAEAMKLNPKLSVAWFHAHIPAFIDSAPGMRESLRKAGLPET